MTTTTVNQIIFNSPPSSGSRHVVSCRCDSTAERYSLCPSVQTRPKRSWQLICAIVHKVASGSGPIRCFMRSCQADEAEGRGLKPDAAFCQQEAIFHNMVKLEDRKSQYCVSFWNGWMLEKRLQDFFSKKYSQFDQILTNKK